MRKKKRFINNIELVTNDTAEAHEKNIDEIPEDIQHQSKCHFIRIYKFNRILLESKTEMGSWSQCRDIVAFNCCKSLGKISSYGRSIPSSSENSQSNPFEPMKLQHGNGNMQRVSVDVSFTVYILQIMKQTPPYTQKCFLTRLHL